MSGWDYTGCRVEVVAGEYAGRSGTIRSQARFASPDLPIGSYRYAFGVNVDGGPEGVSLPASSVRMVGSHAGKPAA